MTAACGGGSAYLQSLLQGLDAVLLAGQVGPGVAALPGQVKHLAVALLPHLVVGVDGQVTVAHALLHHLHLLRQQLRRLEKNKKQPFYYWYLLLHTFILQNPQSKLSSKRCLVKSPLSTLL